MDTELLIIDDESEIIIEVDTDVEVLEAAAQGPRGPQGIPGPAGGATLIPVGGVPLSGHSAVALSADGTLSRADCTHSAHRGSVLGIVANAYVAGADAVVSNNTPLEHAGWAWAPGPVFVGIAGQLTQSLPPGALFSQVIGQAVSPTRVLIDVQPPINLA